MTTWKKIIPEHVSTLATMYDWIPADLSRDYAWDQMEDQGTYPKDCYPLQHRCEAIDVEKAYPKKPGHNVHLSYFAIVHKGESRDPYEGLQKGWLNQLAHQHASLKYGYEKPSYAKSGAVGYGVLHCKNRANGLK